MKRISADRRARDEQFWMKSFLWKLQAFIEERGDTYDGTKYNALLHAFYETATACVDFVDEGVPFGIIVAHQPRLFDGVDDDSEYGENYPF